MSILSDFASPDAWKLVSGPPQVRQKVAEIDSRAFAARNTRKLPLCVIDKPTGRVQRKVARDVCSQPSLYSLLDNDDPFVRGLVRYNLSLRDPSASRVELSYDSILRLGRDPIDPDAIEKSHTARIDSQFASVLSKLRTGEYLSEDETDVLIRFITFSRFRTPTWKRVYYPQARRRIQTLVGPLLQDPRFLEFRIPHSGKIISAQQILEANLYQMAIIEAAEGEYNALHQVRANVHLLRSDGGIPFVTSDNPARPYMPDRIRRIPSEALLGLKDPRVQITFPVGKHLCVLVSSGTQLPLFSEEVIKARHVRRINSAIALAAVDQLVLPGPIVDFFESWLDPKSIPQVRRP